MSQRRIYEIHYPEFAKILRKAADTKKKIEQHDKEAWVNYVRKHDVPEGAMAFKGKNGTLSGSFRLVIIDGTGATDGYYVYAPDEQFCLKFESGQE